MDVSEISAVVRGFTERFGSSPQLRVFRAPGRVNLIGEHTDYNQGFVLPIAIRMACFAAAAPSADGKLRIVSLNLKESVEFDVTEIENLIPRRHWSDYPVGVAQQLLRLGLTVAPLNIAIYSTVPVGSGLSSSAAIEVASALAILDGRSLDRVELAKLAQRAEREFVGVPCGIMDQYVSIFGESGKAIRIDCRSLTHDAITLP
ncbi:MAG: galactokinase, partial [Bryobacteraceae bacterium]|nr:galactokinase [Bryobacteraceae bacterium]